MVPGIVGKVLLENANPVNKGIDGTLLKTGNAKCPEGIMCLVSSRNREKEQCDYVINHNGGEGG